MSQIRREIEEISNEYLFKTYSPIGTKHIVERHMEINLKGLQKRLASVTFDRYGDNQSMSRFFANAAFKDVCEMIYDCLNANEKYLRIFLSGSVGERATEFFFDFSSPIGEGIVKGLDENKLHKMSRICVAVGHSNKKGRKLEIISAYPVFDADEIDAIDVLLDEYYGN